MMFQFKSLMVGAVLAAAMFAGVQGASALPTVNVLTDSGTLVTSTQSPASTSVSTIAGPYGSGGVTITPVVSGWKVTFAPTSAFGVSVNNLAGGKTQTFAGLLAFDINFGADVPAGFKLTANVFEDGTYSRSGTGRVAVNSADLASGIIVTALDGPAEQRGNSFVTNATVAFNTPPAGTWTLFDQVTGFASNHTRYHVVVDNDLLAEALSGAPAFASIAKKDFSIVFTTDGSTGGGPQVPEPASLTMLGAGAALLLGRRRR
jgi:hypothetical protein